MEQPRMIRTPPSESRGFFDSPVWQAWTGPGALDAFPLTFVWKKGTGAMNDSKFTDPTTNVTEELILHWHLTAHLQNAPGAGGIAAAREALAAVRQGNPQRTILFPGKNDAPCSAREVIEKLHLEGFLAPPLRGRL